MTTDSASDHRVGKGSSLRPGRHFADLHVRSTGVDVGGPYQEGRTGVQPDESEANEQLRQGESKMLLRVGVMDHHRKLFYDLRRKVLGCDRQQLEEVLFRCAQSLD
eukprot:1770696-Pyramimonas_sp.AAC.2